MCTNQVEYHSFCTQKEKCVILAVNSAPILETIHWPKQMFEVVKDFDKNNAYIKFERNDKVVKAQKSLYICTDSPEPWWLAYTKYGYR